MGDATHRCEIDYDEAYNERARSTPRESRSPFSQRSEQEWTVERIASYIGTKPYQQFADDINAALAAERQRHEQTDTERSHFLDLYQRTYKQLLSARAAIESAKASLGEGK